ncbi:hypothetical protein Tco_0541922, partial [Tanacetum coccineum]
MQEAKERVKDYAYHKEKMMMCKQAEQGVPLQAVGNKSSYDLILSTVLKGLVLPAQ